MQASCEEASDAQADAAELSSTLSSAICSLVELRISRADDVSEVADSCRELLQQVWLGARAISASSIQCSITSGAPLPSSGGLFGQAHRAYVT